MKHALEAERISSADDLERIRAEWATLHDDSRTTNPFTGPDWVIPWVRKLMPARDEAWIITLRGEGRLLGVAPLHLHRHRFGITRLQMIGANQPWVGPLELPAMLSAPGFGRQVAQGALAHLTAHHQSWDFVTLTLAEGIDWIEPAWLNGPSFTALPHRVTPFVVLSLPLAPRGPADGRRNLKEAVRRARNRLSKQFGADGWHVEKLTEGAAVAVGWSDLVGLHRERSTYTEKGGKHPDVLANPQVHDYVQTVVTDLAGRDRITLYRLVAGGRALAAQLVLRTTSASFISISGFSQDAWEFSPTNYLQWMAVQDAADCGHTEVNLSAWPTTAKLRWSRTIRMHPDFLVVGPARSSWLAASAFLTAASLQRYREAAGIDGPGDVVRRLTGRSAPIGTEAPGDLAVPS
jgi:CelD/BcsL family acetyltransferase involved in cellulose biosynthesis